MINYNDYLNEQRIFEKESSTYSNIVSEILTIVSQAYLLHWQSKTKNEHVSLEDFYEEFFTQGDKLIEVIQGKYGKIILSNTSLEIKNITELSADAFADSIISKCSSYKSLFKSDTEILSIIDEVLILAERLKYLLSL